LLVHRTLAPIQSRLGVFWDASNRAGSSARLGNRLQDFKSLASKFVATTPFPLYATNATPGWHALLAVINGGGRTRFLYAPESLQVVVPSQQLPTLDITRLSASQIRIGVNGPGQTLILQSTGDLVNWQSIATNTLSTTTWLLTNAQAGATTRLFYRAKLSDAYTL